VRRHTAILVLRELATNAPTLFYPHVPQFFDVIFSAVRDPKVQCAGHRKGLAGTASYSCCSLRSARLASQTRYRQRSERWRPP
jgi:hypothetical protein